MASIWLTDTSVGFDASKISRFRVGLAIFSIYFLFSCGVLLLFWVPLLSDRYFWPVIRWIQDVAIYKPLYWGGIRYRVEGTIPTGDVIIASKHQSMWETLALNVIIDRPAFIFKSELLKIPVWGQYLLRMGMCPVDRTNGASAIRLMYGYVERIFSEKRPLCIFPEGTRTTPGESPELASGIYGIYKKFNRPIVPLALNSGLFMPKKGPPRAGVITARFLPPIQPGLGKKEIQDKLWKAINTLNNDGTSGEE